MNGTALIALFLPFVFLAPVAGAENQPDTVISRSPQLVLTQRDYQEYFLQFEAGGRRRLGASETLLEDFVHDFHSDAVLAREAERLRLDQDPLVKSLLDSSRRRIMVGALMRKIVAETQLPDFERLSRERYLANKEAYRLPEKRKVAHILIKSERECAPAEGRKKKPAKEILADLRAGVDFAELARRYSDERVTAGQAGLIDRWFVRNDTKTAPEFLEAVYRIQEPGDLSPLVPSRFGVHIIKLVEVEEGRIPAYEEVRERIVAKLRQEYTASAMEQKRAEAYPDMEAVDFKALGVLLAE